MTYADNVLNNGIKKIKGTLEAELSISEGNPEINISIDRLKMADLGLNITTIGATMQTSFSGNKDVKFRDGSKEYDINIMLDAFDRKSVEDIAELTFLNSKGNLIKLSQFATITQTTGPSQLERKDRISSVVIKSKVLGRPEGTVGADIKEYFIKNPPPSGISIAYDGNMKNQSEGFGSLGLAFMASILFVYLITSSPLRLLDLPICSIIFYSGSFGRCIACFSTFNVYFRYFYNIRYNHVSRFSREKCHFIGRLY